ncbi:hypothetical protein ACFWY9_33145 [Amycolatopsis sp. NPDC059027]|uniref:hypothetical protein n=1 Tax=unclassified Amycolatopsis TaxID=2618356 RepID=UPI00366DA83D
MADKENEIPDDLAGLTDDERRKRGRAPDPVLPGQQAPAYTVPTPVNISFVLWIASGVVLVAGQILFLVEKQRLIDAVIKATNEAKAPGPKPSPADIAAGMTTFLWTLLVGAVVFSLLIALFAYKARQGTRSARSVVTALAIFEAIFPLLFLPQALLPFLVVSLLLAVVALILMYLPSVAAYFPKVGRKVN